MKSYNNGTTTYYRYRKDGNVRLQLLQSSWIRGKQVLDIGCNTGNITIQIAQKFLPVLIEGIDIDDDLIKDAQKKLNHLARAKHLEELEEKSHTSAACSQTCNTGTKRSSLMFMPRVLSQKKSVMISTSKTVTFPNNMSFKAIDILDNSLSSAGLGRTQYDTILCLSVTKWVHLNNGDNGIRTLFRKAYQLLSSSGVFLLEYQPWSSYVKNRNSTSVTKANFSLLTIRPEHFEDMLEAEGFTIRERLGTPLAEAKGFNRPFLVLTKLDHHSYDGCKESQSGVNVYASQDTCDVKNVPLASSATLKKRKHYEMETLETEDKVPVRLVISQHPNQSQKKNQLKHEKKRCSKKEKKEMKEKKEKSVKKVKKEKKKKKEYERISM